MMRMMDTFEEKRKLYALTLRSRPLNDHGIECFLLVSSFFLLLRALCLLSSKVYRGK